MTTTAPRFEASAPSRFSFATADAEMFCEPSDEARRLLRWFGPLTTPRDGRGALPWRALRGFLVAPLTQLTFNSFDLQMFLFDVFHTTRVARVGHLVGMTGVNIFAMALAIHTTHSPCGGLAYAALLLTWYAVVARSCRLWLWWIVTAAAMGALFSAAWWLAARDARMLLWGGVVSGAIISLSHSFEPLFPPRAGDPFRWMPAREYVLGTPRARTSALTAAVRALRVGAFAVIGWFDEVWASPRLFSYNVLRLMLAAGYAPELRAVLDDRARRAWASGNPALDYVGIGGGTFLAPPDAR